MQKSKPTRSYLTGMILFTVLFSSTAFAEIQVSVGGYNFPPFVEKDGKMGIVRDLITKMNSSQKKYNFTFKVTNPARRYRDLKNKKYDVIFFEDEAWGWEGSGVAYSKTGIIAKGGEVFVALNKEGRDQKYFDSFKDKRIRGIFGYHYNFVNMKTDPEILRKQGVSLGQTDDENLKDLLSNRIDIMVLNSFMVEKILKQDPSMEKKLLVSLKKDQNYSLRAFVHSKAPITNDEVEKLFFANIK